MTSLSPLAYGVVSAWISGRGSVAPRVLGFCSFSGDPVADVCTAVFQRRASCLALREERNRVAIDERDLPQIERDRTLSITRERDSSGIRDLRDLEGGHSSHTRPVERMRT